MATTDEAREQATRDGLALLCMALRQEVDAPQRRVYVRGLAEVPADVIGMAADRLSTEAGRRFFPTLPEWLACCAVVVNERRAVAARIAKALQDDCRECQGSGWANAEGPNAVVPCNCKRRALELLEDAPKAIRLLTSGDDSPEAA